MRRGNDAFRGGWSERFSEHWSKVGPHTDNISRFGKNSAIRDISSNSNELVIVFMYVREFLNAEKHRNAISKSSLPRWSASMRLATRVKAEK